MKTLAFILSFTFTALTFGQNIPNGDFEQWETSEELSPTGFKSLGLVSKSTDAKVGSSSLRLENKKQQGGNQFGAITNTDFGQSFAVGGVPYEERPLSLKFWAKYDLDPGDKAHIICYFKSNAAVMGLLNFQIEGSSSGKFVEYSVPITWYSVGLPDTVTFFASSTGLYSGSSKGDGYIIFDDMHFATIYNRNAPLENGEFEKWDTAASQTPQIWSRTEDLLIDQEGSDFGFTWVTKVPGHQGSGIRMQNVEVDKNDIVTGALVSHDDFANILKPSFPVAKQWKYIEGYYKYTSENGDSASITVPMYNKGTLVGGVDFRIGTQASNWTYFSMPLAYFLPLVDSATLLIAAADFDNPKGPGTELSLDQLRFVDQPASVQKPEFLQVQVYPNPASDYVHVSFENTGNSSIKLIDLQGKMIYETHTDLSENHLNISQLPKGIYQLVIQTENHTTSRKIVKHE